MMEAFGYIFIGWLLGILTTWVLAEITQMLRMRQARRRNRWTGRPR